MCAPTGCANPACDAVAKTAFADAFLMGAALNDDQFYERDTIGAALIKTHFNTITSENVWRLKWGWGVAHDVTNWLSASASVDYNRSIDEEDNVRPHSYLEMSLPVTVILPQRWSVSAKYRALVDFNNGDRWAHTISTGIAKRLSKLPLVLSASVQKPVTSSAKRLQIDVTIVYYFERYHSPR